MGGWLTSEEAARRLGVKPPTLYAYVSRGQLRRRVGPDGRRSEYHPDDVASLAVRGRRARPMQASDVVVPTAITSIGPAGPAYRGALAVDLAGVTSFEAVADRLWDVSGPGLGEQVWEPGANAVERERRPGGVLDVGQRLLEVAIATRAADPLGRDLRAEVVTRTGRTLLTAFASAFGAPPPVHGHARGVAARLTWGLSAAEPPDADAVALIGSALVLLADHELAASTLAVRVAASARVDPYAAVIAGLAVLSGPRHGGASRPLERALREVRDGRDPAAALADERTQGGAAPGFGHPLYPDGDPRATRLLALLEATDLIDRLDPLRAVVAAADARGLPPPNIDAALAGLTVALDLPVGSGEAIFAVARTAGWLAHAMEQYDQPRLLRPKAVYTGVRAEE